MTDRKLSFTVPADTDADTLRAAAQRAGKSLSAWAAETLLDRAWLERDLIQGFRKWRQKLTAYEFQFGPAPEEFWQQQPTEIPSKWRITTEFFFAPEDTNGSIVIYMPYNVMHIADDAARRRGKSLSSWLAEAALEKASFEDDVAAARRGARENTDER